MLKIISWNIQQGGGSRLYGIINALINGGFDMIALSEFKNNAIGQKLKEALAKNGFTFQCNTPANSDENSVLIASKLSGQKELYPNADPNFPNNIVTAKYSAFNLMAVYLPHKKKHSLLPYLTQTASESTVPFIIVGDYNTGKNFIDQKGDSFWYQSEIQQLESNNYLDAFRHIHGNIEEYSWFSHQGNGYRYDHTYVHESLLPIVKKCYFLHEWRQNKLSDHSPMVLELG
jgi:exodeoxyribonuclease III